MRHRALFLILGAVACSGGLLETSTTPPFGLPVSLTTTFTPGIVPASGSMTGSGDSVVALISRPTVCGRSTTADAGTDAVGGLVVTVLLTMNGVQNCLPTSSMTTYRAAVHGVPAGTYNASAHLRLVTNGAISDSSIVTTTLRLP